LNRARLSTTLSRPWKSRLLYRPHGRACALTRHPLLRHGCGQHGCPSVVCCAWGICTKKCPYASLEGRDARSVRVRHGTRASARVKLSKIRKRVKLEPSGIFSLHLLPAYARQNFDENFGSVLQACI
jgi:hypothetical protein